ncbi:MAG: 5-formyltetrahydrofolate cyclo-ligase [Lachnospiraceae bacterium]|nr:5-formyltetrahydrofolate cyclo-ligase [Lachnospiraceae bacterium]
MSKTEKAEKKKKIRSAYLEKRNQLGEEKRAAASKKIREWVFANKRFKAAKTIFVYASYKSEVATKEIIQGALRKGKQVAVPKVHGDRMFFYEIQSWEELFPGYQGILEPQITGKEPIVPTDGDVMLLPGTVFDRKGNRIGYGGGYYDRYLERIWEGYGHKPYLMALGFACQISPKKLPVEEHDKKMDCILTERRVIMPKEENQGKLGVIADVVEIVIELGLELVADLID